MPFCRRQLPRAEVEYLNALHFNRTNAHVIAQLGTIYFQQGCVERASPFLSRASGVFTNDIDLRVKLAAIYLRPEISRGPKMKPDSFWINHPPTLKPPI